MKLILILGATLIGCSSLVIAAEEEILTNTDIVEMQKLDMGESLIIQKIKSAKGEFDTSVAGLKALKENGVPESVISVMMSGHTPSAAATTTSSPTPAISSNPLEHHDTGLWLYREHAKKPMVKLIPRDCGRSSGWNKKSRAVLPSVNAVIQLNIVRPVFYYYAPAPNPDDEFAVVGPTDPNHLILARMEVRADKNERRLALGKDGFFGDKKSGLESRAFVATSVEQVADRIYRVAPAQDLSVGEYCFVWAEQASRDALKHGQVDLYDFSIKTDR